MDQLAKKNNKKKPNKNPKTLPVGGFAHMQLTHTLTHGDTRTCQPITLLMNGVAEVKISKCVIVCV